MYYIQVAKRSILPTSSLNLLLEFSHSVEHPPKTNMNYHIYVSFLYQGAFWEQFHMWETYKLKEPRPTT